MKKKSIQIITLFAIVVGTLFGGYKWGEREGRQQGTDEALTAAYVMTCVNLKWASEKEFIGDSAKARDFRNQLLFNLAMGLDDMTKSKRLDEATKQGAQEIAQFVADHYWKYSKENAFFTKEGDLAAIRPDFTNFLERYKRP
jgi:hypothetical protein